jgi:predicted ATPase
MVRIVLTGGPGAGKTAILEMLRHALCAHSAFAPETASLLFRGGFPRDSAEPSRCAAQRAIFHVQTEIENVFSARPNVHALLCDRGTIDSVAYWPQSAESFWRELETTVEAQLARYDVVIHLRVPSAEEGYHTNGVRTETAEQAAAIDTRIAEAWKRHPRVHVIGPTRHFLEKARRVLALVAAEVPEECRPPVSL